MSKIIFIFAPKRELRKGVSTIEEG